MISHVVLMIFTVQVELLFGSLRSGGDFGVAIFAQVVGVVA